MSHRSQVMLLALVFLASACGGSDDDGADVAPATTPAPQAPAPTDADAPGDAAATPGGSGDADMSPENCPELVAAISGAANAAAITGNRAGLPVANMRALADRIPEISDDLTIIADAYETFLDRLEELGVDFSDPASLAGIDPPVIEQMDEAAAALDEGRVAEANANIEAFFERECS